MTQDTLVLAFLERCREEIEGQLRLVLGRDPEARVCVGIVAADGQPAAIRATDTAGFARVTPPAVDAADRPLHDAIAETIAGPPPPPGCEWVVSVEHKAEGEKVTVSLSVTAFRTEVRAVVRSVLTPPRNLDERFALLCCEPLNVPNPGPSVADVATQVDAELDRFDAEIHAALAQFKAQGLGPTPVGKEVFKWLREPGAKGKVRHRLMLMTLVRAGLVADAQWLARAAVVRAALIVPPPGSAQNTEVLAMAMTALLVALYDGCDESEAARRSSAAAHLLTINILDRFADSGLLERREKQTLYLLDGMQAFLEAWKDAGFARLEVSHKLSAALCLTDVPDGDAVRAPWRAWSLLVPNDLFGDDQPSRLWCVGTEPRFLVDRAGVVTAWSVENAGGRVAAEMLRSLVRSVCLVISDPERVRAEGKWRGGGASKPKYQRPPGPPPEGARYVLAQPVEIDLREAVKEALTGKRKGGGGSPKVQFLVRGHYTHQAYGPKHSLRRWQWIEPYWKGDPAARVLLRGHRVNDGDSEDTDKKTG